jgi:hypothetical protein
MTCRRRLGDGGRDGGGRASAGAAQREGDADEAAPAEGGEDGDRGEAGGDGKPCTLHVNWLDKCARHGRIKRRNGGSGNSSAEGSARPSPFGGPAQRITSAGAAAPTRFFPARLAA